MHDDERAQSKVLDSKSKKNKKREKEDWTWKEQVRGYIRITQLLTPLVTDRVSRLSTYTDKNVRHGVRDLLSYT